MKIKKNDLLVAKINDPRLAIYEKRTRSGRTQVFYMGNDAQDFSRYKEDQKTQSNPEIHDKADTIRLEPPEKHLYAVKEQGEWWWANGCSVCNGKPRDTWASYLECTTHDVCVSCSTPRSKIKDESVWGGKDGWQCYSCEAIEREEALAVQMGKFVDSGNDGSGFHCEDSVLCPHCGADNGSGFDEDEDTDCHLCENEFSVSVDYIASYSTIKKPAD